MYTPVHCQLDMTKKRGLKITILFTPDSFIPTICIKHTDKDNNVYITSKVWLESSADSCTEFVWTYSRLLRADDTQEHLLPLIYCTLFTAPSLNTLHGVERLGESRKDLETSGYSLTEVLFWNFCDALRKITKPLNQDCWCPTGFQIGLQIVVGMWTHSEFI
jgi:hypothetical protein